MTWLPGRKLEAGQRRLEPGRLYHVQTAAGAFTVIDRGTRYHWRGLPPLDLTGAGTFQEFRTAAGLQ